MREYKPVFIKSDKRFKPGTIKKLGNQLRGNPETMALKHLDVPKNAPIEMQLNPPIVVSAELAKKLRAES